MHTHPKAQVALRLALGTQLLATIAFEAAKAGLHQPGVDGHDAVFVSSRVEEAKAAAFRAYHAETSEQQEEAFEQARAAFAAALSVTHRLLNSCADWRLNSRGFALEMAKEVAESLAITTLEGRVREPAPPDM